MYNLTKKQISICLNVYVKQFVIKNSFVTDKKQKNKGLFLINPLKITITIIITITINPPVITAFLPMILWILVIKIDLL